LALLQASFHGLRSDALIGRFSSRQIGRIRSSRRNSFFEPGNLGFHRQSVASKTNRALTWCLSNIATKPTSSRCNTVIRALMPRSWSPLLAQRAKKSVPDVSGKPG
jgi:hypothetical protein